MFLVSCLIILLQKKVLIKGDEEKLRFLENIAQRFFDASDLEQLVLHELEKIKHGKRGFYFGECYVGDEIASIAKSIDPATLSKLIYFDEHLCATALKNVLQKINGRSCL